MAICITGYSVMDNSIIQPVIRHFHNTCACGIHPFHPVFLQKQIFCQLRKTLHIYKAFYSLFALYIERFLSAKSILRSYTCLFCKISFSSDKFRLFFLYLHDSDILLFPLPDIGYCSFSEPIPTDFYVTFQTYRIIPD